MIHLIGLPILRPAYLFGNSFRAPFFYRTLLREEKISFKDYGDFVAYPKSAEVKETLNKLLKGRLVMSPLWCLGGDLKGSSLLSKIFIEYLRKEGKEGKIITFANKKKSGLAWESYFNIKSINKGSRTLKPNNFFILDFATLKREYLPHVHEGELGLPLKKGRELLLHEVIQNILQLKKSYPLNFIYLCNFAPDRNITLSDSFSYMSEIGMTNSRNALATSLISVKQILKVLAN